MIDIAERLKNNPHERALVIVGALASIVGLYLYSRGKATSPSYDSGSGAPAGGGGGGYTNKDLQDAIDSIKDQLAHDANKPHESIHYQFSLDNSNAETLTASNSSTGTSSSSGSGGISIFGLGSLFGGGGSSSNRSGSISGASSFTGSDKFTGDFTLTDIDAAERANFQDWLTSIVGNKQQQTQSAIDRYNANKLGNLDYASHGHWI